MRHIPHTSRIFIGLLIITLLLTYIVITLSYYQEQRNFDYSSITNKPGSHAQPLSNIDTKDWKNYQDRAYPIAFSYPDNWIVSSKLTGDFYDILLNIPKTNADIHIYISENSFYGLDGLKQEPYQLRGLKGTIVNNNLIGIKTGEYYYTFDASLNSTQLDEFHALMQTATFE